MTRLVRIVRCRAGLPVHTNPLANSLAGLLAGLLLVGLLTVPVAANAATERGTDRHPPTQPGRTLVHYRVRPGDTATAIATRFHAWTAELLRVNHRGPGAVWRVGERVLVPVVTARARPGRTSSTQDQTSRASKSAVRAEVARTARAHGMGAEVALAIAWQESGWKQHVRSPVGAIGTMQVMPGNRVWLSTLVGRPLRLSRLHDNVTAGVVLFRTLRSRHGLHRSIAAYYQGIGSLREHGRYPSTKAYVRNVVHHLDRLRHGWDPLSEV